jgi:hypothetical protein
VGGKKMTIPEAIQRVYVFPHSISDNIHDESFSRLLGKYRKNAEFVRTGGSINDFIGDLVNEGIVTHDALNEFLFKELFYGKHKHIYIMKINSFETNLKDENNLLKIIMENYDVNSLGFNELSRIYFNGDEINRDMLAAVKLIKSESGALTKIRMIFVEGIKRKLDNGDKTENSYIPIEIDFQKEIFIVKVNPKTNVLTKNKQPSDLAFKYMDRVQSYFGIKREIFGCAHKEALFSISKKLLDEVIQEMVKAKTENVDISIKTCASEILKNIKIDYIENRKKVNNVYDLEIQILRAVENMYIADVIDKMKISKVGFDGHICSLKFSDGKKVKATLKGGSKRRDALLASDAYFGLRNSIDNSKELDEMRVVWYILDEKSENECSVDELDISINELHVLYDASRIECLFIKFFDKLNEGDFYYALNKYEEFERGIARKVQ